MGGFQIKCGGGTFLLHDVHVHVAQCITCILIINVVPFSLPLFSMQVLIIYRMCGILVMLSVM